MHLIYQQQQRRRRRPSPRTWFCQRTFIKAITNAIVRYTICLARPFSCFLCLIPLLQNTPWLAWPRTKTFPQCWHSFGKIYVLWVKFSEKLARIKKSYSTSPLRFWCEFMTMAQESGLRSEFLIVEMLECSMGKNDHAHAINIQSNPGISSYHYLKLINFSPRKLHSQILRVYFNGIGPPPSPVANNNTNSFNSFNMRIAIFPFVLEIERERKKERERRREREKKVWCKFLGTFFIKNIFSLSTLVLIYYFLSIFFQLADFTASFFSRPNFE